MKCERCGISCMDAEDYRDHLPCSGSVEERQAARIRKLEDVVRELLCRGESLSFYYASSHGKGCGCVPCGRLREWEESVIKALELLNQGGK